MLRRILAISGSLRSASSNSALLRAARALAPAEIAVVLDDGLATLPFFNADLDGDNVPPAVAAFRAGIAESDGLIMSSPEYAHGVPGVLENGLDWLVGSAACEIVDMPVAVINTSPRATHAMASLVETLRTMGARVVAEIVLAEPIVGTATDDDVRAMPAVRHAVAAAFEKIATAWAG